ncbi:LOW QUALITY PROTEIN: interferon-stimulated 20 kDa exonuclease-like 2 [Podargus strigoides]
MADLILNVISVPSERPRKKETGNRKHESFVRRRRALERRGVLKQKQLPVPGKGSQKTPKARRRGRKQRGGEPPNPPNRGLHRARCDRAERLRGDGAALQTGNREKPSQNLPGPPVPHKLVAVDCEMVGTGPGGRVSALARCSIVGYRGDVVYDRYIRPAAPIVDYRTRWSGIRRQHSQAVPFGQAQREILRILGKVVVGHAIHNDFKALKYSHPAALTRDTSKMPLLNRRGGFPENTPISLKRLAKELLHKDIQVGSGHSSVGGRRAAMELYKVVEAEWEQHLLLNPEQE